MDPTLAVWLDSHFEKCIAKMNAKPITSIEQGMAMHAVNYTWAAAIAFAVGLIQQGRNQDAIDLMTAALRIPFGKTPVQFPWEPPA